MKTKITIVFAICAWISALLAQTPDKPLLDRYILQPSIMHELIETSSPNQTGSSHLFQRAYLPSDLRENLLVSQTLLSKNFWGCTIDGQNAERDVQSNPLSLGTRKSLDRLPFLNEQTYTDTTQTAWMKHYASGLAPSYDNSTAIAVDNQGYIYVTGASTKLPFGIDYLTIKYSSAGDTIWTKRYDGSGEGDDISRAIAVDSSGNVYVTGVSKGSGTSDDYATIKYDASGNQLWAARYNGPGNASDWARTIVVDGSGNAYVTGWSEGSGTSHDDYATIKYDASGNQLWAARYNGPGNAWDWASALTVDGVGNIYVTGSSSGVTPTDFVTVKYNASGNQTWVARYNGPGNSSDNASSLVIDGFGNVYVTGESYDSGTYFDYATIKYDASGNQLWASRYNGPGNFLDDPTALAIDGSGNVYVTGKSEGSGTNYDYATIKYDASGNQLWATRYNGPGNSTDWASALAVDSSGNLCVTGSSSTDFATVKYDANGNQLWVRLYTGSLEWTSAIAVDNAENVYVTGGSYDSGICFDYATIKYNASGNQLWAARYDGPGNSLEKPTSVAIDGSGNVYVTGSSTGLGTSYDYVTIKYDASGNQLWATRYNGSGNGYDEARALVVDRTGNVYATGISYGSGSYDYATIKYDASGNQLWTARYNGPTNSSEDWPKALAIDGSGNVYVTGWSEGLGSSSDYATIKYDATGNQLWAARYNGPGNGYDEARALVVDSSGVVYVTGGSTGLGSDWDYVTIKYNASGNQLWVGRYNGPGNSIDVAEDLAVDGSGNVYVTGASEGSGTSYDYATIKYNASGNQLWVARYNAVNSLDIAWALAVDGSGNVYVTGESHDASIDYATIKYDVSGNQIWVTRYSGTRSFSTNFAVALAVDGSGNVYVTGRSSGSGNDLDYATIKYNASGNEMWVARYNVPAYNSEWTPIPVSEPARILVVDGSGNVYIVARSEGSGWSIYITIKYIQQLSSVVEIPGMLQQYSLEQNYPNPFNPSTTIKYSIPTTSIVSIKVYDILGREVATLVNEQKTAGNYSVQFNGNNLASGVYLNKIQSGNFVDTKKMILLK